MRSSKTGEKEMGVINVNKEYFASDKRITKFYHYTSPEALVNIISNSSIRLTHCAFLNDIEEYMYIDEILKEIIEENADKDVTDFIKGMFDRIDRDYSNVVLKPKVGKWYSPASADYYVLSGSNEQDSLSLWSYYVRNNDYCGYAIRFDVIGLCKIIEPLLPKEGECLVGKVVYDSTDQKQIIINYTKKILDDFEIQMKNTDREDSVIDDLQERFFDFIQRTRLFFKRKGFENEQEVRLVVLTDIDKDKNEIEKGKKRFSDGYSIIKGIIKPYIEYTFPKECLPIKEIVLSPTIEKTIGEKGIGILMKNCNYEIYSTGNKRDGAVLITQSKLKLRY